MPENPKRVHARYPCRLMARVRLPRSPTVLEGEVVNIGVGGALLRLRGSLAMTQFALELDSAGETFSFDVRVMRVGEDPQDRALREYGLAFLLREGTDERLRRLIDRVRTGPPLGKRVQGPGELRRDYFSL